MMTLAQRLNYGPLYHLFGDSLFRGYALGGFQDTLSPSHPMYQLGAPASMMNLALEENGLPWRAVYHGNPLDDYGQPIAASQIAQMVQDTIIAPGDIVVFEQAGPHGGNPALHKASCLTLRDAASGRVNVMSIFMTMFDYPPAGDGLRYDDVIDGKTINQATREAALDNRYYPGVTRLIDLNGIMDQVRQNFLPEGVPFMHPDGVHPNVFGTALMAGEIMRAGGHWLPLKWFSNAKAQIGDHWPSLQCSSKQRAEQILEFCLGRR